MNNANAMAHLPGRPTAATATTARRAWLVAASTVLGAIATFAMQASAAPLAGATGIAAGDRHACALLSTGGIKCWGNNNYGKLGNGSTIPSSYAVDVQGIANAVDVATGHDYGCAVTDTGGVKCWGLAPTSPHGSGSATDVFELFDVTGDGGLPLGLDGKTALNVAAGTDHACAIVDTGTVNGAVYCWGSNEFGQLGNGATSGVEYQPVQVVGISGAKAIAAGGSHTCAIVAGGVKCWGDDFQGQLGDSGTLGSSAVPVDVVLGQTALAIAAGDAHTCALLMTVPTVMTGEVACWGWNYYGQAGALPYLSNGAEVVGPTVVPMFPATAIGAGGSDSCAVLAKDVMGIDSVRCWGLSNTQVSAEIPMPVDELSGATRVAVGGTSSGVGSPTTRCALVGDGVQCWGDNDWGQLGNGVSTNTRSPVDVVGITDAVDIAAGGGHTCAALALPGGVRPVKCWGANNEGQLGDGTFNSSGAPVNVYDFGATQVATGAFHTCALRNNGNVACWGNNIWGQLGHPPSYDVPGHIDPTKPVDVPFTSGAIQVVAGYQHSCALMPDRTVWCWGWNLWGQLGLGDTSNRDSPAQVPGLAGVDEIAAGAAHTCARLGGAVKCWGTNYYGQLGNDGSNGVYSSPQDVSGLSGAAQITAIAYHTCARLDDGTARCWGDNGRGALGDGTMTSSKVPVAVKLGGSPLTGIAQIAAGAGWTCARVSGGKAMCWGGNSGGTLGNPDVIEAFSTEPVEVAGLTDVVKLAAGYAQVCAITGTGRVKCWGRGENGELGDGRTGLYGLPATVLLAPTAGVTATTLSASPGASSYGQPVTLTATVFNGNAPTGSIEFSANDFYIAGCEYVVLTGGQAQCITSALPIGTNALKATYGGDTGNALSSGTLSYEVTKATVTLTITAHTPDPSAVLSPVMVTVALGIAPGAGTPTGTVAVSRGVDGCTITLPATSCAFTPTVAGTVAIAAQYGGDANFAPQPAAPVSHTTTALPQAITFPPIPDLALGNAPFLVSATASSGLAVSFASATPAVCTVSGNTVTLVSAGTCTITADQAGDAIYAPAPQAIQSFTVGRTNGNGRNGMSTCLLKFSPPCPRG